MSTLYYPNTLSCIIVIVLFHRNNSPRVDMSIHSDTHYPDSEPPKPLLVLLNDVCVTGKQQISIS